MHQLYNQTFNFPIIVLQANFMLSGEPNVLWKDEKLAQMIINENLQYVILDRFTYGRTNFQTPH